MKPVPLHLLAKYMAREMPSHELAKILGVHPVTVRRNIQRPPRVARPDKRALIRAREAYRKSVAHLPIPEMCKLLHATVDTARRIKKKYHGT